MYYEGEPLHDRIIHAGATRDQTVYRVTHNKKFKKIKSTAFYEGAKLRAKSCRLLVGYLFLLIIYIYIYYIFFLFYRPFFFLSFLSLTAILICMRAYMRVTSAHAYAYTYTHTHVYTCIHTYTHIKISSS